MLDDEVEYQTHQGAVRYDDGEEYAGLYAVNLPEGYRFQWHVWRQEEGPHRRYRVVLDLFTPWDAIDWDPGHRWLSRLVPKRWAEGVVRVLASEVRDYVREHGSNPGVHEALEAALETGFPQIVGWPPASSRKRKQDWSPRKIFRTRRKNGER